MKVEEQERIFNCVLIQEGYWKGFDKVAQIIEQELDIKFKQKLDNLPDLYLSLR